MAPPTSTRTIALPGGRSLTVDDIGDPDGTPVLFLHGTPDSRLARHPDDGLAATCGVRLLAIDRPGYGGTSPTAGPWSPSWPRLVAADIARLLDALRIERCAVLAWSGGALTGAALAATAPLADGAAEPTADNATPTDNTADPTSANTTPTDSATDPTADDATAADNTAPLAGRVAALGIVAGLVPRQAYDDPAVRAAGEARLGVIELADIVAPGELGPEVAPMVAPFPCDEALASEHQAEHRSLADAAEIATVPGGTERMAAGLVEAVRHGLAGVAADVETQARPLDIDLGSIGCPVHLWYGTADAVTPPAFGRWWATAVPQASLTIVDGAAHYLALTRWTDLLTTVAAHVGR